MDRVRGKKQRGGETGVDGQTQPQSQKKERTASPRVQRGIDQMESHAVCAEQAQGLVDPIIKRQRPNRQRPVVV